MEKPYIGGQAVLEGVMMRSPKSFVVAVRRPDGSIAVREQAWSAIWPALGFLRWPIFRGALVLAESLHNGYSALKFSAQHATPEEPKRSGEGSSFDGSGLMMAVATVLMVGLFIALPHLLTYLLGRWVGPSLDTKGPLFHLVDGVLRLLILLSYIFAIAQSEDAKRLFQYHGAEHKAIWAYESEVALTVENARRFTTVHPRCGTSFLVVVAMVAVLVHLALVPLVPQLHPHPVLNQLLMVLVKVPMAFPIAGIAYELQRLFAKGRGPRLIRWLMAPGMWLQRVTTREPTDDQLEIALLSLSRALERESGVSASAEGVRIYPSQSVAPVP